MNATTPKPPETQESQASGENVARIALACFDCAPVEFNFRGYRILRAALQAALRRNQVNVIDESGYYLPSQVVFKFTVSKASCAPALQTLRDTLCELELLTVSAIAIFSPEGFWQTLQGPATGGPGFEFLFLRPEHFAQAEVEQQRIEVELARSIQSLKAMAETVRARLAAPDPGPDNNPS